MSERTGSTNKEEKEREKVRGREDER